MAATPPLSALRRHRSLDEVLRWALAGAGPRELDVHPMDEFRHDVVLSMEPGVWLVFDTT